MTKILIVDDEPRILLLMKSLLKANGFEVETAKDGPAALEIVRSGEIQIVVTDLRMSPMDGMSLFKEINPTFHVRKQNPSGCWGFAHRSSLHSRFRRVGSFA